MLLDHPDIKESGLIFFEKSSQITSIEYAFDSDMHEFIKPMLSALESIDSFIIDVSKGRCITLFEVIWNIFENARKRGVFTTAKDEPFLNHPTIALIEELGRTIFTVTKDSSGKTGTEFLKDFKYSKASSEVEDIPKPKIMKKMPPRMKKKLMEEYNSKVEQAKEKAKNNIISKTSKDIFDGCFAKNDHISFPYIYSIMKPDDIEHSAFRTCLEKRMHRVIFEIILDHCIKHGKKQFSRNTSEGEEESEDDESYFSYYLGDKVWSILKDLDFKEYKLLKNFDCRKYYIDLHELC